MRATIKLSVLLAASAARVFATPYVVGADARPNVQSGRIVTDAYNDATMAFDGNVHHFGYLLGQSPGNPYFTSDPGFNAVVGSGLPSGQQLRFDVVRHLSRWDGHGVVKFVDPSADESLRFQFGSAASLVTATTDAVAGFPISNVASGGSLHRHLNAFLQGGVDGTAAPTAGLYFTAIRLAVSGGGVNHSDALYIAYDNGLPDADFQRGMAYLADPTPGDANFDASVNFDDLLALSQNYGANVDASWFDGDFNGDRQVNFDDLLALAQRYGASAVNDLSSVNQLSPGFRADWALAQSLVPEPASLGLALALLARRRRRASAWRAAVSAASSAGTFGAAASGTDIPSEAARRARLKSLVRISQGENAMQSFANASFVTAAIAWSSFTSVRADFDVSPSIGPGNKIVTGAFEDATETFVGNVRVFDYAFGETPGQPYFLEDPGFHPRPGTSGFSTGSLIGIRLAAPLRYWSGVGAPAFSTVSGGSSIRFDFGANSVVSTGGAVPSPAGYDFAVVDANGEADDHLETYLLAPGGTTANPGTPAAGIYLASLNVTSSTSGVLASDAASLLFDNGIDDDLLQDARVYVRDTFAPGSNLVGVPEPTSVAVLAAAGALIARRRR